MVALRRATAAHHAEVEDLPLMAALMAPTVAWGDYCRYLAGMAYVYGTLEPPLLKALDHGLAGHPDLRSPLRSKLPALFRDLAAHGIERPSMAPWRGPVDLAGALGGLYVLEGATLGARVIARHLRHHLVDGRGIPWQPGAFMGLHDDAQGPSAAWRRLGAFLDALAVLGLIEQDRVIDGARATFEQVHRILAGLVSPP